MTRGNNSGSFALLSPCGLGNLGDAAIQMAVIQNIRSHFPQAKIFGITMNPKDTQERHGIPSYPIGALSRPGYPICLSEESPPMDAAEVPGIPRRRTDRHFLHRTAKTIRNAIVHVARFILPRGVPWAVRAEMHHIVGGIDLLRNVDMLIVSGGGQLDDFFGNAWGHPYAMFKWSLMAYFMRIRIVVLGVGFGSLKSRVSRFFMRRALALTDYRSYRDHGSKKLMQQAGFRRDDPVCPDLAFSLAAEAIVNHRSAVSMPRRRVCISPMAYCHPRVWPRKDQAVYSTYLGKLADVAASLIRQKYTVVLLTSDNPDKYAVSDMTEMLVSRLPEEGKRQLEMPEVDTVSDFLDQVAGSDVVIASRMHGVLLSFLAVTPVVALSYDRKVDDLMMAMEQGGYCLNVNQFLPDQVIERIEELYANRSSLRKEIESKSHGFHQALEEQYNNVFSGYAREVAPG